jgi:hypothetical protein
MPIGVLSINEELNASSRLPTLSRTGQGVRLAEWGVLIAAGVGAAICSVATPELHLRIPGHAILRGFFPMALGLAIVPRRFGGVVMGVSALLSIGVMNLTGLHTVGTGAATSLGLIGPMLDVALSWTRRGWQVYLGFILAGLATNMVALFVRAGFRIFEMGRNRGAGEWWSQAAFTYPVCGIIAGLVSAAVWFQLRRRRSAAAAEADV